MKKIFRITISGFNKIYRWIFNQTIKIKWEILESALRLKLNINNITTTIKVKQSVAYLTPRLKERFEKFSSSFKLKQEIVIRTLERYELATKIKLTHAVKELRFKTRMGSAIFDALKIGKMTLAFQLKQFYKLKEWDYQIPDLPDSPMWKLSELDGLKLIQMDEK